MLKDIFNKKEVKLPEQEVRELLRANLNLINLDLYYGDDPLIGLKKEDRLIYLKTFFDLYKDKKLIDRIKYHTNKQAIKTLENSQSGIHDMAGALNINGMAFIMNDIEKLANMYIKEKTAKKEKPLDKFSIIPTVG
jgi:hypothetical protein